jgi:hypothetical protein
MLLADLQEHAMRRRSLDDWLTQEITRRTLLGGGLALFGLSSTSLVARTPLGRQRFARTPFTLGVASGDPSPDGMVLWTRIAPEPLEAGGGMAARWRRSSSSTSGSTAAIRSAATARAPSARPRSIPRGRCSATISASGCSRDSTDRAPDGTCCRSR